MDTWEQIKLERDETYRWQIGPLSLWAQLQDDEYLITSQYTDEETDESQCGPVSSDQVPEDLTWSRFIVREPSIGIRLRPALPDRPVVVSPELPIKLTSNSKAVFYVSIPVWVQVTTGKGEESLLMEIPSRVLSNTWFGDTMTGELCYDLSTRARREFEKETSIDHLVLCPVSVRNDGSDPLDFQKLSVHVENLRVYRGKRRLWSNEVGITYMGGDQPAEIRYSERKPNFEEGCELVNRERVPVQRSILRKSFGFIKSFTVSD